MPSTGPFVGPIPNDIAQKVSEVVPRLDIRDIRLIRWSAHLKEPIDASVPTEVTLGSDVKCDPIEDTLLGVLVNFTLSVKRQGVDQAETVSMSATFQLTYEGKDIRSIDEDKRMAFANVNAVHNAWPYLRELVQNMSGRMSIPPMTIPLLKIRVQKPAQDQSPTSQETK